MGRLARSRCYLCGPIDRCKNNGSLWRNAITEFLEKLDIIVLNPLKKPTQEGIEDDKQRDRMNLYKNNGAYDLLSEIAKEIRHIDLRLVDVSDFLIVNLDLDIPMCGTYEEIFQANRQKKPIIINCPQGVNQIPNWLFGTLPYQMMFSSLKNVVMYINNIDNGTINETHKRWVFLDFDK